MTANKNGQISDAERALWRAANKLKQHASPEHVTFVMNNLRAFLVQSGYWLEGKETKIRPRISSSTMEQDQ